ncbi:MAG: MTAP family purine nucleoside phosphorylase [Clostridia bacterium]|nr:MTAP family purine nucleoside phosphorylase [Clostridia bacterium]
MKCAIIGGTNIEAPPLPYKEEAVATPYGDVVIFRAMLDDGHEVLFRSRHGVLYSFDPPHVNYRANIYALHKLGVTHVVGITSVGACDYAYKLGSLCLLNDFLDFTQNRQSAFDREHRLHDHTGMENVFDPELNETLERLILERGISYSGRAIYACTEGPRFETAAEARMLRMLGAQIIGMTIIPEAPLARDLGMRYAAIGIIGNYCTGMSAAISDESIDEIVQGMRQQIFELCFDLIRRS